MVDTAGATPTEPELITLICPECDESFEGPPKGRGSAPFRLGSHRNRKHGVVSEKKRAPAARGRTAPTDDDVATAPVLGIVRDMQAQIGTGTGPPDAESLTKAFGRGVSLVTMAVASYAAETEEGMSDDQRNALVDYLSLSDKGGRDMMRPLAKLAAPSKLNRKFGRQVVENVDAVASVAEGFTLVLHWRRYFNDRRERNGPVRPDAILMPSPVGPSGSVVTDPVRQMGEDGPMWTTPPPQGGIIVTPEMVKRGL